MEINSNEDESYKFIIVIKNKTILAKLFSSDYLVTFFDVNIIDFSLFLLWYRKGKREKRLDARGYGEPFLQP